ncbi:MAG: PDZ domain-containing protein [Planctomycetota bacterium]
MKSTMTKSLIALAAAVMMSVPAYAQDSISAADIFDRVDAVQSFVQTQTAPRTSPRVGPQLTAPRIGPQLTAPRVGPQLTAPRVGPQVQPFVAPGAPPVQAVQPLVAPQVVPALPSTCAYIPKLQLTGRILPGVGMQVLSVDYGGVACRAGLEYGDIIVEMGGRRIVTQFDYDIALYNAAVFGGGHLDIIVKNVRYRPGCSLNPMYVHRHIVLQRAFPMAGPIGRN